MACGISELCGGAATCNRGAHHTHVPADVEGYYCSRLVCSVRTEKQKCFLCMLGINYVRSHKLDATVEQPVNGEGREKQWSEVMCNLTTQWAVPGNGLLNAGSVREINS